MALTEFERSVLGEELSDLSDRLDAEAEARAADAAASVSFEPPITTTPEPTPKEPTPLLPPVFTRVIPKPPLPIAPVLPVPGLPIDLGFLDGIIGKIVGPIGAALDTVQNFLARLFEARIDPLLGGIDVLEEFSKDLASDLFSGILSVIQGQDGILATLITKIRGGTDEQIGVVTKQTEELEQFLKSGVNITLEAIEGEAKGVVTKIGDALDESQEAVFTVVTSLGQTIGGGLDSLLAEIEAGVSGPLATLQESLPLQVGQLGDAVVSGLGNILDLPELLGDKIKDVFSELGTLFGLDSLVSLFKMFGQFTAESGFNPSITEVIANAGPGRSEADLGNRKSAAVLASLPIIGGFMQTLHPGLYEKFRQQSFEEDRPNIFSIPDGLELLRRFPDDADTVISDLQNQGWSNDRIEQLTRLRFQLTPVADTLEAWRRGFVDDAGLTDKLTSLGWSEPDQELLRRLTFRIPPIQDMILFAIRGVFDVEESRAFGEFEGLPSELEQQFITNFGIEGGDFSRQVQVFATEAQKLGLSPEWVAAYWTSHWRLPSLQTAYEMFHRLQPDILEAEADRVAADGFTVPELSFEKPELDRLVRAQDFSSFWRPKLSAIAFNPLTRVDIRRIAKLLGKDKDWMIIQYRKVGFSPFDANLMADFTIAFNAEPDQEQTRELRDLTKTVILDFVENDLFTAEEGVTNLQEIGYDDFAAEALVNLELAKRERALQRDRIDFVEEQVKFGILGLNDASVELDQFGVPAAQKDVILRKLEIQLAPKPSTPSKGDLDNFFNQRIIGTEEYREGLTTRGFADDAIDLYVKLDRRLPTKKELDALVIQDLMVITDYESGLVDLGYAEGIINRFIESVGLAKAESQEEE